VEEEWLFSKLAFIKNDRRNRLEEEQLNACLNLAAQQVWGLEQFPFQRAVVNSKESASSKPWQAATAATAATAYHHF